MFVYNIVLFGFAISPAVSSAVRNLASISTCRASDFTCLDGTCVRAGAVCDTYWDCPDGSDESSCYSSTNSNLPEATVSHERYRRQTPCGIDQWRCTDGTCIAVDGKCDGKIDCPNRSDEAHALCRNVNRSTVSAKCVLPPYPEHGTYVAINAPYATPGQSFQYAQLNIICEQGYGLVSDTMPYCLDGTWFISVQKCVPFCRLYPDVSVHYYCQFPGTNSYRICNQSEPSGTFVRPECNTPIYGSRDWPLSMTCQSDGKWNRITKCKPECGRVTPDAEGLIWGGTEAVRGELPWHVAIYQKPIQKKNHYEQICGGSLVSNWIVISAAHCFWDKGKQAKQAASNYAVATAKLFREWDHKDDKDAQKSELRAIEIPSRYLGVRINFEHDIAVLILETPFVYYTYVRPVCLDLFDHKFNDVQLQAGNFGKVAGWGLTGENGPASPVLKAVQLPFVPFQECIRITPETFTESITGDKICAGYNNGTAAVCKGDSGGGLSFPEIERGTNRYYLRGVASTAPKAGASQQCNVATVTTFTAIYQHKDFINQFIGQFRCKDGSAIPVSDLCDGNSNCPDGSDEEIGACAVRICPSNLFQCADGACVDQGSNCNGINECADGSDESDELCNRRLPTNPTVTNRPIQSGKCILPPYPEHGTYAIENAPNATPGQGFPSLKLNVICRSGYEVEVEIGIIFCLDGTWSNSIPKCIRFCKLLDNNPSVHFHCLVSGSIEGLRPCNAYEPSGTVVKPECNSPNYYSAITLPFMRCIDGSWDYVASCSPECGRVVRDGEDLIIGSSSLLPISSGSAKRGELPWHASIYRKATNPYMQICVGSLISSKIVLSVAHCFWNEVSKQQPASLYAVAIDKIHRPWDSAKDVNAQKSDIKEIKIPVRFQGIAAKFQDNIAILILKTAFVFNTYVRPICLDFDVNFESRQLQTGKLGKVAGWGLTSENGMPSQDLKAVVLPYMNFERCITASPADYREYITSDKICAGYMNGTAICRGDSGSGLAFPETDRGTERFYLRGIVSSAPQNENLCNSYTLIAFTQISKHEHFIKEYL